MQYFSRSALAYEAMTARPVQHSTEENCWYAAEAIPVLNGWAYGERISPHMSSEEDVETWLALARRGQLPADYLHED